MRVDNNTGIRNLCAIAVHLLQTMPVNAATKFAVRTVLREAINKSNAEYKGNINRKNCRYISAAAEEQLTTGSSKSLVADHAIPVSVSLREFEGLEKLSVDAAAAVVAKYAVMTLITAEEDTHLREIGLVKKMPLDWDGSELLARYRFAGILLSLTLRSSRRLTARLNSVVGPQARIRDNDRRLLRPACSLLPPALR